MSALDDIANARTLAFVNVADPALVELAAHAGFGAAVIDAEHGPLSIADIANLVRAADAVGMTSIVRVPAVAREFVLRSLDSGAGGVLAPQIDTAEQAERLVAECRYPPVGIRGAGFYARQYGYTKERGADALRRSNDTVIAGIQVESTAAVEAAESIVETEGVDYVFVGPTDLSVSHGSCDPQHPWVRDAMRTVAATCARHGRISGAYAANPAAASEILEMGFDTVAVGVLPLLLGAGRAFVDGVAEIEVEG